MFTSGPFGKEPTNAPLNQLDSLPSLCSADVRRMIDLTEKIMALWSDTNVRAAIVTAFLGGIGEVVRRVLTPSAKIAWGVSHQHYFMLPTQPNPLCIRTKQIWIQNIGRKTAANTELTLNYRPEHFEVWPPIAHLKDEIKGERFATLSSQTLSPREHFTVTMLDSMRELPDIVSCRWEGGVAKMINMGPQQIFPPWAIKTGVLLMFIGALSVLFLLIRILILAAAFG